ncbi:hypothetical protein [Aquipuribacter sp. SD81]|uniref:hypothetical protein n=1 Tax=Aquipuribacter sp. SD81 TaxID=3127703 RepID=UPI00301A7414
MGSKRRVSGPTFAEVVSQLPEPSGAREVRLVRLAQEEAFTDADGVRWQMREGVVEGRALRKVLFDEAVRVLHDDAGEVAVIAPEGRERFWVTLQERMEAWPHATFYGATFRNDRHESLLVVNEDC